MSFFSRKTRRDTTVNTARPRCRLQVEALEDRSVPSAGALDPTFGTGGMLTTAVGPGNDEAAAVVIQGDGKVVAAGWSENSKGIADFAVTRYNSNGSLDTSFSGDGKATVSFSAGSDSARGVALQADGKIVVAGSAQGAQSRDFALVRFNANGTLDKSFGSGGKVTTDFAAGSTDSAFAIAIQGDGKIVVAGFAGSALALARYNPNGSLDTSFSGDGKASVVGLGHAQDVAIQSDGKIVVSANASDGVSLNFALVRFNSDGSLDTSFDGDGIVTTDFGSGTYDESRSLAIQTDGKIVVGGTTQNPTWVVSNGVLTQLNEFALARYNVNGTLDTTFDGDGKATLAFPNESSGATAVALQSNGKIVLAGRNDHDFALARFNPDGSPDLTFGTDGKATTDFGRNDYALGMAIQGDGKIVAAGGTNRGSNVDFALARYEGDAPLQAATAAPIPSATILTYSQVQPLLTEALARWQASGVDVSGLGQLDIRITNLGGNYLGMTDGHTIWLDDNAAGWGWFVDATPGDDSEFTTPGNQGEKHRMDLLTVLTHEIGHLLGHDHDESGVMAETLSAGERWTPSGVYVDGPWLFAAPSGGDETLDPFTGRRKGW